MCVKFFFRDLNLGLYPPLSTNTYICEVIIAQRVHCEIFSSLYCTLWFGSMLYNNDKLTIVITHSCTFILKMLKTLLFLLYEKTINVLGVRVIFVTLQILPFNPFKLVVTRDATNVLGDLDLCSIFLLFFFFFLRKKISFVLYFKLHTYFVKFNLRSKIFNTFLLPIFL